MKEVRKIPGVARDKDSTICLLSGGPHPQPGNIDCSHNVYVNGRSIAIVGDSTPHGCGSGKINSGSATVYACGQKVARIGDTDDHPCLITGCSNDVFVGG